MRLTLEKDQKKKVETQRVKFLYETYGKLLQRYSTKNYQLNEDEAWDLVYKTIYRIAEVDEAQFENSGKLKAYLFRAQINNIYNHLRASKKNISLMVKEDIAEDDFSEPDAPNVFASPQMILLQEELDKMEDWQRVLLLMRGQDASYKSIAMLVGRPERQLKVYYGRLKLQLIKNINQKLKNSKNENQ